MFYEIVETVVKTACGKCPSKNYRCIGVTNISSIRKLIVLSYTDWEGNIYEIQFCEVLLKVGKEYHFKSIVVNYKNMSYHNKSYHSYCHDWQSDDRKCFNMKMKEIHEIT